MPKPRKSKNLKLVKATERKGRRKTPRARPGLPTPPASLSDRARVVWGQLVPELHATGVVTAADGFALERLCEVAVEVEELKADIRTNGRTYTCKTKNGDVMERRRPAVAMLQDADKRLRSWLREFHLTTAARGGEVLVPPEQTPEDGYFE
jgi:P27 family predicted phage terminase small subunit